MENASGSCIRKAPLFDLSTSAQMSVISICEHPEMNARLPKAQFNYGTSLMNRIRNSLLSLGYFPRELPPTFTTREFGENSAEIISEWKNSGIFKMTNKSIGKTPCKRKRRGAYTFELRNTEAEVISKPKRGYERRDIHITHPVPQSLLANELAQHWRSVQGWLSRAVYSEDKIRTSGSYDRAIKDINFQLHRAKKSYIECTADWLVKTDITRFYPTIYTHSIPWAAYGKEKVKKNLGHYTGSLADRIDLLVRSCNRNQTVGIPIGPETSGIIAEVISARIDCDFKESNGDVSKSMVDRLQDDWTVGVGSLDKAEKIISSISKIYRGYGLDINGSKTSIEHIVSTKETSWVSEIGAFLSHRPGQLSGSRLREFLTLCVRLQANNRSEPIINYALTVIESRQISQSDVEALESFLLKAAVVAPNSMDRVCRVTLNIHHKTKSISTKRVTDRFVNLAERNLSRGHLFEAIWLLYTIRGLKRPFRSKLLCDSLEVMNSSVLALIVLDMKSKGLGIGTLPISKWESEFSEDTVLSGWSWLLAYEGFRHGWLNDKKNLMQRPFFKPLIKRNISFYQDDRNIQSSKSFIQRQARMRQSSLVEVRALFEALREVNLMEY